MLRLLIFQWPRHNHICFLGRNGQTGVSQNEWRKTCRKIQMRDGSLEWGGGWARSRVPPRVPSLTSSYLILLPQCATWGTGPERSDACPRWHNQWVLSQIWARPVCFLSLAFPLSHSKSMRWAYKIGEKLSEEHILELKNQFLGGFNTWKDWLCLAPKMKPRFISFL